MKTLKRIGIVLVALGIILMCIGIDTGLSYEDIILVIPIQIIPIQIIIIGLICAFYNKEIIKFWNE